MQHSRGVYEPSPRCEVVDGTTLRALYFHVPFCRRVCAYCDFAVTALGNPEPRRRLYLDALEREIARIPTGTRPISIFFGGGTPSALHHEEFARILAALRSQVDLSRVREISIECNPEDFDVPFADRLAELGFDRVSLGVQTLAKEGLRRLTRLHDRERAETAVAQLKAAGIAHVSVDLILAWPGQTNADLERDIDALAEWGVDHVSCYVLTYEPGTPFTRARDRGLLDAAVDQREVDLLRIAFDRLSHHGYIRYEVSNYARPGHRCVHNPVYWRREPYLGLGPSAASFTGTHRFKNLPRLEDWASALLENRSSRIESEELTLEQSFLEFLMLSLRTRQGIRLRRLEGYLRREPRLLVHERVEEYLRAGLIERTRNSLRATSRGIELADELACGLAAHADAPGR